jgi:hypothetical protein
MGSSELSHCRPLKSCLEQEFENQGHQKVLRGAAREESDEQFIGPVPPGGLGDNMGFAKTRGKGLQNGNKSTSK